MEEAAAVPLSPARRAAVMAFIMVSTIMVVLDTTIANVAMPHMQASLGATPDSISWVLTSYILASAVSTPMTGWLSGRFGRTRLFTAAVIGFTVSSALCGIAGTLSMMVFARIAQGVFGAFIMPMTQAFMYDISRKSEQIRAVTIWGMSVMLAPILGPMLGGYLTDTYDWRWVFFVNVPIGIVTAIAMVALMPEFPSVRRSFDKFGFVIIIIALGALQLVLDRGTQEDWLSSTEILIELGLCIGGLWMLVNHLRTASNPIIPRGLFRDRNFVVSLIFIFVNGAIITAGSTLLAPMLQSLFNYPVFLAGVLVVPRGAGMMVSMIVAGRLLRVFDSRLIIVCGMVLLVISLWLMTGFSLQMGQNLVIWSGVLQGFGMGLVTMPMNLLSVSTLSAGLRTDGAALYALFRNVGGSVAISITSALLAHNLQVNHAELGTNLTAIKLPFLIPGVMESMGFSSTTALAVINAEVSRQSMMIAYLNDYWLMMWATILVIPLTFLTRPVRPETGEAMHVSE
jgi:DHA2 family multidrug resistance protein